MRRRALALLSILLVLLGASTALAIPVAWLQLWSDPGEYVGGGGTYDVIYQDSGVPAPRLLRYDDGPLSFPPYYMFLSLMEGDFSNPFGPNWATLTFSTSQPAIALQPGYYPDAVHPAYVEPGHPGMKIEFQHRGIGGPLAGQFTIFEAVFSADFTRLLTFVVEFEQNSGGATPALRGRLEYRADGLATIPEPSKALLMLLGLAGLRYRRLAT